MEQKINHKELEIKYDLSDSNLDKLIKIEIGKLILPTGKIITGDPFFSKDLKPFSRTVKSGVYPVKIYIDEIEPNHYRIAYAKIKFKDELATNWILAISDDMNIEELKENEFYGFPVDGGLACFADEKSNTIYNKNIDESYRKNSENKYFDLLLEEFEKYSSKSMYSGKHGDWNNHVIDKKSGLNIIMFTSGWGDGFYPTYWGYNNKKETVELTIDFLLD